MTTHPGQSLHTAAEQLANAVSPAKGYPGITDITDIAKFTESIAATLQLLSSANEGCASYLLNQRDISAIAVDAGAYTGGEEVPTVEQATATYFLALRSAGPAIEHAVKSLTIAHKHLARLLPKAPTQEFSLRAILTLTTGIGYISSMDDLCSLAGHITGDGIYQHQIIRAAEHCKPVITDQYPGLPTEGPSSNNATPEQIEEWLQQMEAAHGTYLEVIAQPEGWEIRNPVEELAEMMGPGKPVYVVNAESDPEAAAATIASYVNGTQPGTNS